MLYIHQLRDLCPKTADIESVQLLREIKQKSPSNDQIIKNLMSLLEFSSMEVMQDSLDRINPTIEGIKSLISENDPVLEAINLHRAVLMLAEIFGGLENNTSYFNEIMSLREDIECRLKDVIYSIKSAGTNKEKNALNIKINEILNKMLRSDNFTLRYEILIYEKDIARINDLHESMINGFFFHITVKEHIDRLNFDHIKQRIPSEKLEKVNEITKNILEIKKGIDKAYEFNMSIIKFSVFFYSYIKWINS